MGFGILRFEVSLYTTVDVLFTKTEPSNYLVVALDVCPLQIIKQTATLRDHLEQATPRMIVLLVNLEMFSKLVDSLAE